MAGRESGGTVILHGNLGQSPALPSAFGHLLSLSPGPLKVLQGNWLSNPSGKNYSLKPFSFSLRGPVQEVLL